MIKVIEHDNGAKELLAERAKSDSKLRAVIILELHEDGTQRYFSSNSSQYEKCFLKCFFDSMVFKWFEDAYRVDEE